MSSEVTDDKDEIQKKATRITAEAHAVLKSYCDRTGRTQIDVLAELTERFVRPELERLQAKS